MKTASTVLGIFIMFSLFCSDQSTMFSIDEPTTLVDGSVRFSLSTNTSMCDINKIVVTLSRSGYSTITDSVLVNDEDSVNVIVFDVPIGTWHLKVDGLDINVTVIYTGETEVNIMPNQRTYVDLVIRPVTGSLEINIRWGNTAGKAVYFDGGVNYINIETTSVLNNISDALTIEAWVKPKDQYYNTIIAKGQANFFVQLAKNLRPGFRFIGLEIDYSNAENYWDRLLLYYDVPEDEWTHMACTYSGQEELITIYIN